MTDCFWLIYGIWLSVLIPVMAIWAGEIHRHTGEWPWTIRRRRP